MTLSSTLNQRVTIQQLAIADDGYGGQVQSWEDFATVFASVQPILLTRREMDVGGQLDATASYRVAVRMRTDVTAAMRVLWNTHTLSIHSLQENGELLSMLTYEEQL